MKTLKTMLLGSAGAAILLTAGTAAYASDAPVADKGREPVWRCDAKGFIEYPGSDVCFKMGGKIEAWINGVEDQMDTDGSEDVEFDVFNIFDDDTHNTHDTFNMSVLARLNFDIRQATSLGVVRAYIEMQADDTNRNSGDSLGLRHAYIQFGNWLFGKTWTLFRSGLTPGHFVEPHNLPGDGPTTRLVQVRYTAKLGNGVTLRLAIEDQAHRDRSSLRDEVTNSRAEVPDFVASLSIKGSWGEAHFAAAVTEQSFILAGESFREVGWAVQAAVELEVPGTKGDLLMLQGQYGDGATRFVESGARHAFALSTGGGEESTESWAVHGGWEHVWTKTVSSVLGAAYVENDYGSQDPTLLRSSTIIDATVVWFEVVKEVSKRLKIGASVIWGENTRLDRSQSGDAISVGVEADRRW